YQRSPVPDALLAPALAHPVNPRPSSGALGRAANLPPAAAPAAVGDHGREAPVDAGGINGDGTTEARADDCHARALDGRMISEKAQGIAGVFDLLEADDATELALALPAAAHVECKRDIAEAVERLARRHHVGRVAVAAEAVQHQKGSAPLAAFHSLRQAQRSSKPQIGRRNDYCFFFHLAALK